jgi:cytochrome c-type biogenesis protein CcmH/NrfG
MLIVICCCLCLIMREYVMSQPPSATIIAFPRTRAAAPGDPAAPERLQRALAALEQALAEQRSAVAKWRQSLGELRGSVQGLGEAFGAYHDRLGVLAEGVSGLNLEARRMEAWADAALASGAAGVDA